MKKCSLLWILIFTFFFLGRAQNNLPYPIIFVHGLTGSDQTFERTFLYMSTHFGLGQVNVFDVVLNADNNNYTAKMSKDVKWTDFYYDTWYGRRHIHLGPRNFADNMKDYHDGWTSGTNLFAINFKEERIKGAAGTFNDLFDYSDQAAIFKQGYALKQMIKAVLEYTHAKKVILIGHSMGGLAIREYLQRTDQYGRHVNWIDPNSADGHKVAMVVTVGTPHLGSNAGPDPTKSAVPYPLTEAMRDLRYSYDTYTNCGGYPQGIYLFGGYEYCIASTWWNHTFYNVDVNCDGDENDYIVGIDYKTYDNPRMPLPRNIHYTWVTSLWADLGGNLVGDGAVNINRQWLHYQGKPAPVGITDTLLMHAFHTSEPGNYFYMLRALDEPDQPRFAYEVDFNKQYIGFITFQPNYIAYDIDYYKLPVKGLSAITLDFSSNGSGVNEVDVLDQNLHNLTWFVPSGENSVTVNVAGNDYVYLVVEGTATNQTWKHPYQFYLKKGPGALHNMQFTPSTVKVYVEHNVLKVETPYQCRVDVFDVAGRLIAGQTGTDMSFSLEPHSIYIVQVVSAAGKLVKKVLIP